MPRQIDLFPQNLQVNSDPTNRLGVTSAQINHLNDQIPAALAKAEALALNAVLAAIDKATGLNLVLWSQQLQSLFSQTAADNLLASFQSWLASLNVTAAQAAANWTTFLESIGLSASDVAALAAWWNGLWGWLSGTSNSPALTGTVPAPAVANTAHSAQPVPNFPNPASIQPGGGWSYDGNVSFSGTGGAVKFTCSGVAGGLRGIVIPVQAGQIVALAAQTQWSGLTYSGSNPIQLQLIPWSGTAAPGTAGTPVTIAQIASPASSGTWTSLSGTYTVPSSGVGFVQARLVVTATASVGSVWWSACTTTISGGYLATLENDLTILQADSSASTAAFGTLLTSWEAAITGYTNWSTFITALETAWNTYSTTESGLTSSAIFTLQNLFNTLLGISPSTGLMAPTNVSNVLGTGSLGADVQAILDYIANALGHTGTGHTLTQIETYLGFTNTTASNGSAWATRLTNDLLITSDVFHLVYNAGTSTDAPGTLGVGGVGAGKPTWYSAWNDLLSLTGVVNSTTAPTDTAPTTGSVIQANTATANTASTNASIAIASNHATNDAIVTATGGTPVTGSTPSDITTGLTNFPASNVVGLTPANVAFGAVGGGNYDGTVTAPKTLTETHSVVAGDGTVYSCLAYTMPATGAAFSSAVTYGGSAMTMVKQQATSAAFGSLSVGEVWKLKAPPSGSQTVSATLTRTSGSGSISNMALQSVSYSATKEGTVSSAAGGGSTPISMSMSSVTGRMVLGVFVSMVGNLSSYTQTQRGSTLGVGNFSLVVGDAAGAASVSFGAALASPSTAQWAGIMVELEN